LSKLLDLSKKRKEFRYDEKRSLLISGNGNGYPVVEYSVHREGQRPQCRMHIIINENVSDGGLETANIIINGVESGKSFVSVCKELGYNQEDYTLIAGPYF